jgi:hypothetical protein
MASKLSAPAASLAEGAERLERVIRGVKDRQLSDAHNVPVFSTNNAFAVSPEEAWSKKFMTAGIGPTDFKAPQMPTIAVSAPVAGATFQPAGMAAPHVVAAPVVERRSSTIGDVLAKPGRRRSWLGRLLRGA